MGDVGPSAGSGIYVRCVSSSFTIQNPQNYTDNSDGTVRDNYTGLTWQKCSRGQTNDSTCSGTATTSNWADALSYCNSLNLAGKTWRLPNRNELHSIVDYTKSVGAIINTTYFPATMNQHYFTSSTNLTISTSYVWAVYFFSGNLNFFDKTNTGNAYVRCVTGP